MKKKTTLIFIFSIFIFGLTNCKKEKEEQEIDDSVSLSKNIVGEWNMYLKFTGTISKSQYDSSISQYVTTKEAFVFLDTADVIFTSDGSVSQNYKNGGSSSGPYTTSGDTLLSMHILDYNNVKDLEVIKNEEQEITAVFKTNVYPYGVYAENVEVTYNYVRK